MLRNELKTLFRRRRTMASLAALAAVPLVIALAITIAGDVNPGEGPPFIDQVTRNGYFVALTSLAVVMPFLLPLVIAIVAGDTIAGEANLGTLRYLLIRPVSRLRLLVVKYVATIMFVVAAAAVVAIAGLMAGAAFFGVGDVVTLSADTIGLPEAMLRALLAVLVVAVSMAGLAAFGLFVSTLTEQPVGAMVATLGVVILSQIVDSIPQLDALDPALLTHYWLSFVDIFRVPMSLDGVMKNVVVQLAWFAVFASAAWARLTTKDVLA